MQNNRSPGVEYSQLDFGLAFPIPVINDTVCFTGHRFIPAEEKSAVEQRLKTVLRRLVSSGYMTFASGGALGFDTVAARAVLALNKDFPEVRLRLVLPCRTQSQSWSERAKAEYDYILSNADEITYVSDKYTQGCMLLRNRRLVDMSGVCVCYLTQEHGGTAYTVRYARSKNVKLINLCSDEAMLSGLSALFPDGAENE